MADLMTALRNADAAGDTDAAKRIAGMIRAQSKPVQQTTTQPQAEQLAPQQTQQQEEYDDSFLGDLARHISPVLENVASIGSSIVAEPIAGIAGLAQAVNPFAEEGVGAKTVKSFKEALTYKPKSQLGLEKQQAVGEALQPVGEAIKAAEQFTGDIGYAIAGPTGGAIGAAIPVAIMEGLGFKGASKARGARKLTGVTDDVAASLQRSGIDIDDLSDTNIAKIQAKTQADIQTQLRRVEEFKSEGVTPTRGDITQKLSQQKTEAQLFEAPDDAGSAMRQQRLGQSRQIRANIESMVDDLGVSTELGESVKSALIGRKGLLKKDRKALYDKLGAETKNINVPVATVGIKKAFPEAGEIRDIAGLVPAQAKTLSNLLDEFGITGRAPIEQLSISNFEKFRKRLNNIEKSDQTGQIARAVVPIRKALDEEINMVTRSLEASGNPNVAALAKDARKSHSALMTEFDSKALTSTLIDRKRKSNIAQVENSQIYQKLSSKSTPIEQYATVVDALKKSGDSGQKAIADIKNRMLLDIIDSSFSAGSRKIGGERTFGTAKYQKVVDELRQKMEQVFSKSEMKKVDNLHKIAESIRPAAGAVPKGSAGYLMDVINKIGLTTLAAKVPVVGAMAVDTLTEISKKAKNKKALEAALKKPKLKDTVKIIEKDYPSLAVALGIGSVTSKEDEEMLAPGLGDISTAGVK